MGLQIGIARQDLPTNPAMLACVAGLKLALSKANPCNQTILTLARGLQCVWQALRKMALK